MLNQIILGANYYIMNFSIERAEGSSAIDDIKLAAA
jgi:hypothetical protein